MASKVDASWTAGRVSTDSGGELEDIGIVREYPELTYLWHITSKRPNMRNAFTRPVSRSIWSPLIVVSPQH